jgi:hypothetical protein
MGEVSDHTASALGRYTCRSHAFTTKLKPATTTPWKKRDRRGRTCSAWQVRLPHQAGAQKHRLPMADCPSSSFTGIELLHRARHVHDALAEEERARRHHEVAEQRPPPCMKVPGEEDHDAA